jgi:HSP20 family molecular chaperone IbpA
LTIKISKGKAMENIEHLNRLFLYSHPQCSRPSERILSESADPGDDHPVKIILREYSKFFLVDVLFDGASWDDVNMNATPDSLKIFASIRRDQSQLNDHSSQAMHHHIGSITRYLRLPVKINPAGIESKFVDGVFILRIPKEDSLS